MYSVHCTNNITGIFYIKIISHHFFVRHWISFFIINWYNFSYDLYIYIFTSYISLFQFISFSFWIAACSILLLFFCSDHTFIIAFIMHFYVQSNIYRTSALFLEVEYNRIYIWPIFFVIYTYALIFNIVLYLLKWNEAEKKLSLPMS